MGFFFGSRWTGAKRTSSRSSDIWYYVDQGEPVGPLTLQQLKRTIATVPNAIDLLVWRDKFPNWKKVIDVPELGTHAGVSSPLTLIQQASPALHDKIKTLSARQVNWLSIIVAIMSLGSAGSRVGREEMARISVERRISKEITRWLKGMPADVLGSYVRGNWAGALIFILCLSYGVYDGVRQNSLFSGVIAGILCAGLLNILVWTARKYRVKRPSRHLVWAGNISFGLGCVAGLYGFGLIIHQVTQIPQAGVIGSLKAIGGFLPSAIFYFFAGWGVRYVLGANRDWRSERRGRDGHRPKQSHSIR